MEAEINNLIECYNCRNNFATASIFCDICKMVEYCSEECKRMNLSVHILTCNADDKFIAKSMRQDMDNIFQNEIFMHLLYSLNHHWSPKSLKCIITKNNICSPPKRKLFEDFFVCEIICTEIENTEIIIIYNGLNNINQKFTLTCDPVRSKLIYESCPQFELDKLTENKLLFVISNIDFCAFEIAGKAISIRIDPIK